MTHEEEIELIKAHKEGNAQYYSCGWEDMPKDWRFNFTSTGYQYRIKPVEITREEITAQWVKDNGVKVGDKLGIKGRKVFGKVEDIGFNIMLDLGEYCDTFNVDLLYIPKYQQFTFEDRELFRGKWVRHKKMGWDSFICGINADFIYLAGSHHYASYEDAFNNLEFIDGTPFGKEVWE